MRKGGMLLTGAALVGLGYAAANRDMFLGGQERNNAEQKKIDRTGRMTYDGLPNEKSTSNSETDNWQPVGSEQGGLYTNRQGQYQVRGGEVRNGELNYGRHVVDTSSQREQSHDRGDQDYHDRWQEELNAKPEFRPAESQPATIEVRRNVPFNPFRNPMVLIRGSRDTVVVRTEQGATRGGQVLTPESPGTIAKPGEYYKYRGKKLDRQIGDGTIYDNGNPVADYRIWMDPTNNQKKGRKK